MKKISFKSKTLTKLKKLKDKLDLFYWDHIYHSRLHYKYSDIKCFIRNSWHYRKELTNIYHCDYETELFMLINRFNEEFAKDCVIHDRYYASKKTYRKALARFYTIKELCKRIELDDYYKEDHLGKMHYDENTKNRDFEIISRYLSKYSGGWWL